MKNFRNLLAIIVIFSMLLTFCTGAAFARNNQEDVPIQEVVVLGPGDEDQINFYINKAFNPRDFGPMAMFIIFTIGAVENLELELVIDPEEALELDFTDVIKGNLIGFGLGAEGEFGPVLGDTAEIPINSNFGLAAVSAIISEKDTHYRGAIPCGLVLTATELEEEESEEEEESGDE